MICWKFIISSLVPLPDMNPACSGRICMSTYTLIQLFRICNMTLPQTSGSWLMWAIRSTWAKCVLYMSVTGHGPYRDYFARFKTNPLEQPRRKCGQPHENSSHVLDGECQLLSEPYLAELARLLGHPPTLRANWFVSEMTFCLLSKFARESLAYEASEESTRESRERTLREQLTTILQFKRRVH